MPKYMVRKIGVFKSTTDAGEPCKTYVYYGREIGSIAIRRYAYGEKADGWEPVKKYKGKWLHYQSFHLQMTSLNTINEIVMAFLVWNTKILQNQK